MTRLDADRVHRSLDDEHCERLAQLEVFGEIDSTNSYLMQQPGPVPGQFRVAATDNQTAGRGRLGRTWQSPPGSGLCLSMAYTFARSPDNLPALTLAIGLGVIEHLGKLNISGVQLKWPNDLMAMNGKLGGILTEAQARPDAPVTVVTGVGLNIDLDEPLDLGLESDWAPRPVALKCHVGDVPGKEELAASLISGLGQTFVYYEKDGFAAFVERWAEHDWLLGRELTIETPQRRVSGVGAGVAADGALLVETSSNGLERITSGSVIKADLRNYGS